MLGINLRYTTVKNPQANVVSERINKSIKSTIYVLVGDRYTFNNALCIHQMMYNSSFHNIIRISPNNIYFCRPIANFMDTFNPIDFNQGLDA